MIVNDVVVLYIFIPSLLKISQSLFHPIPRVLASGEAYRAVARAASGRDAESSLLRAASAFEADEIAGVTATLPKRNMSGAKCPIEMTVFVGNSSVNGGFLRTFEIEVVRLTRKAAGWEILFGDPTAPEGSYSSGN